MNAFSACMLDDTTADSILIKESAYKVVSQDKDTIQSILEIENQGIIDEMNARREMYIQILENVGKEEVLTEAVSMKVVAAIIAACIAAVTAIIALIMGKKDGGGSSGGGGGGSSTPSPRPTTPSPRPTPAPIPTNTSNNPSIDNIKFKGEKRFDITGKDSPYNTDKSTDINTAKFNATGSAISHNPYWTDWYVWGKSNTYICGNNEKNLEEYVRKFKAIARHVTCDVNIYQLPNKDILNGEFKSVKDLYDLCTDLEEFCKESMNIIKRSNTDNDDLESILKSVTRDLESSTSIMKFGDKCEEIISNIEGLKIKPDDLEVSTKRVVADEFLMTTPEYVDKGKAKFSKNGEFKFIQLAELSPSKTIYDIKSKLHDIMTLINKFPNAEEDVIGSEIASKLEKCTRYLRTTLMEILKSIKTAIDTYSKQVKANLNEYDTVANCVLDLSNYKDEYNSNYVEKCNGKLDNYLNVIMYDEGIKNIRNSQAQESQEESALYESAPVQEYTYVSETDEETMLMMESAFQEVDNTIMRYNIRRNEFYMRAINQEAMIFISEDTDWEKYKKLCALNETLGNKIKRIFYNTIAKLKEIFAKFMEKLRGNFGFTKNYLDKYKDIILKKPFNNNEYSTQDLLTGIKHIEEAECPMLDLANLNETLDSQEKFFMDVVLKKVTPTKEDMDAANNGQDQAGFWKSYFCMTNHDRKYTGPEFQKDCLTKVYEFLYDIRKTERVIKNSIKNIDDTTTKILKQAGVDVNKPEPEHNEQPAATPNQDAAVWSNLYQKYFIYENGVLKEVDVTTPADQQAQQQQQANPTFSQRVKTVEKPEEGKEPDNTGTAKNSNRGIIDTRLNNYVVVCSTMLKAKMSACEFIRSESMAIIRTHVKSYIGNDQAAQQQQQPPKQEEKPKQNNPKETITGHQNTSAGRYA